MLIRDSDGYGVGARLCYLASDSAGFQIQGQVRGEVICREDHGLLSADGESEADRFVDSDFYLSTSVVFRLIPAMVTGGTCLAGRRSQTENEDCCQ